MFVSVKNLRNIEIKYVTHSKAYFHVLERFDSVHLCSFLNNNELSMS